MFTSLGISRAARLLQVRWEGWRRKSRPLNMESFLHFYRGIWSEAAHRLGAEFSELDPGIWRVRLNDRMTTISNFKVQLDDPVVLNMAGSKPLTYRLLRERGLPVPDHLAFDAREFERAWEFMGRYAGGSFVIKPATGTSGARGITTHVRSRRDLLRACACASLYGSGLLVERLVPGEPCRLLILDGRLIHASRRRGTWVRGDGRTTVRELLRRQSAGPGPRRDDLALLEIRSQGIDPDSIPPSGKGVYLGYWPDAPRRRLPVEVRTVFNEDITERVGEGLRRQAIEAASALGSRFAGVDVITLDLSLPLEKTGGAINEINTTPGLHHHYGLRNESWPPPADRVLGYLLEVDTEKSRTFLSALNSCGA